MDHVGDCVAISNGNLSALIDPLGAELVSLQDCRGREYMTDADPAFWSGHAPLLFPIVGRLNDDVLRVDGLEYRMQQHGFARRMLWSEIETQRNAVTFRLSDTAATRVRYPFTFELTARYSLEATRLRATIKVRNPGRQPLPFSFGFHPAFAWPLPDAGEKEMHSITFEGAEASHICRLDADGLLAVQEETPLKNGRLPLHSALFTGGALIWDRLQSRRLKYSGSNGPWLEILFDLPQLGIWQKPGANFICIEPWSGLADTAEFADDLARKRGIILLPPGDEANFTMEVIVHERPHVHDELFST
ncbi:aldose 1-epimerase family protein [Erythrobacter sp. sf7]|uniref:Aldose 1-epimerase family protein n=1 Tax=Erythrobacter fulvus TaxID=2987523 RepID=A0ABT5JM22_9SPHN|nr:aldose 1-epimerase family protein [Erythrobacter fulvus]MDC8753796.1 aldose 1-epimerase family protein [Erythrobacter fulvus]